MEKGVILIKVGRENQGVVAVDPGKNGGIAKICEDYYQVLPLTGKPDHDIQCVRELFTPGDSVVIEDVHSIFGASAKSNFSFGRNLGLIEGVLWTTGITSIRYIAPKVWQKAIGVTGFKESKDRKAALIEKAFELFPGIQLLKTPRCTSPHSGMADALLIAYVCTHFLKQNE